MCKYSILTHSPSRESPTLQQSYWYRLSVTELSMFPMIISPSGYGARTGLISVEPPLLSQGGGAMMELVVADGWFVGAITDNSESSLVDSINRHFQQSRQSLVWAILCKCFLSWEVLLCAILARACTTYCSVLAMWVRVMLRHMHICTRSIQICFHIFFHFICVLLSFHCLHIIPIFSEIFPIFLPIPFTLKACHFDMALLILLPFKRPGQHSH